TRRRPPFVTRSQVAAAHPTTQGAPAVPAENLTRSEAIERATIVDVRHYDVALDLTGSQDTFASRTTVTFSARPGASTFIDLIAPQVHSVELNGRALDPAQVFADSRVELADLAQ